MYFDVSVEKVEFVDGEQLKDSWTYAVRAFVTDMNTTVQQITFGVFTLMLWLIQFLPSGSHCLCGGACSCKIWLALGERVLAELTTVLATQ